MEVIDCGRDITYSRTSDKKYGDQVILDDVSLDVKKGEVIVVVGSKWLWKEYITSMYQCPGADSGRRGQTGK